MVIKEIQRFSEIRYKAKAYISYLFNKNLPNRLPGVSLETINRGFENIAHEIDDFDAFYVLDANGVQLENSISLKENFQTGKDENRSNKSYYYRAVKEQRCVLTDPYPSTLTHDLCVTASTPIYNEKDELKFIACIDVSLSAIIDIVSPGNVEGYFSKFLKFVYSAFVIALFMVAVVLFTHGIKDFVGKGFFDIDIEAMFESTIVLTLALAIFDLVKTIFEEEVLGKGSNKDDTGAYKTMVRFIGSIIIALAIEALMLVFKFAITAPENIINAIYLIAGVAILMIALSIYLFVVKNRVER